MAWLECIYVYYWPEYLIDFTFLEIRNKKVEIIIVFPVHLSEGYVIIIGYVFIITDCTTTLIMKMMSVILFKKY